MPICSARILSLCDGSNDAKSVPSRMIFPSIGETIPEMSDRIVDLPEPLSPSKRIFSPLLIEKFGTIKRNTGSVGQLNMIFFNLIIIFK